MWQGMEGGKGVRKKVTESVRRLRIGRAKRKTITRKHAKGERQSDKATPGCQDDRHWDVSRQRRT